MSIITPIIAPLMEIIVAGPFLLLRSRFIISRPLLYLSQLQPNIVPFLDLLQNALISFLFPSWYFLAPHPYKIAANTSRHAGRHKKHNNEPLPIGSKQFAASYTFQKIRFLGPASEAVTPCTSNKHARVPLARKWVFDLLK
jgi:hypothetical protein